MKELHPLGLAHYEFEVEIAAELDDGDSYALITVSDDYDFFKIRFLKSFIDEDGDHIERVIVHELCHVPFHRLIQSTQLVEDHIPVAAGELWGRQLMRDLETAVERFARTIYTLHER